MSCENLVDVRGACCPYPQLKTKATLDRMSAGQILRVLTDKLSTAENIRVTVEQLGDRVLGIEQEEGGFIVIIERGRRGYKSTLGMSLG
ncbi:MAG: sulfurtransferase TusA family protein [Candidatus Bathyarchaeia archaeon]